MSRPAVSQHVRLLQQAGLIRTTVVGRHQWHELAPAPLALVERWAGDVAARAAKAPALNTGQEQR
jgi:DNA-binding transcriptional ArsR family regulator